MRSIHLHTLARSQNRVVFFLVKYFIFLIDSDWFCINHFQILRYLKITLANRYHRYYRRNLFFLCIHIVVLKYLVCVFFFIFTPCAHFMFIYTIYKKVFINNWSIDLRYWSKYRTYKLTSLCPWVRLRWFKSINYLHVTLHPNRWNRRDFHDTMYDFYITDVVAS